MDIVTHRFPLARIQEGLNLAAKPTGITQDLDHTRMSTTTPKKMEVGEE